VGVTSSSTAFRRRGQAAARSTKIRESRQDFADEVVARLVINATGGTPEKYAEAMSALEEGVAAFDRVPTTRSTPISFGLRMH
jgi:hypothetical protein